MRSAQIVLGLSLLIHMESSGPSQPSLVQDWPDGLRMEVRSEEIELAGFPAIAFEIHLSAASESSVEVHLAWNRTLAGDGEPEVLVPGFICGSNNAQGAGDVFPQVIVGGDPATPAGSAFRFRADRSSVCAVMLHAGDTLLAVATEEGSQIGSRFAYHGLGFDLSNAARPSVTTTVGCENWPARYNGNTGRMPRWSSGPEQVPVVLGPGEEMTVRQWLIALPDEDGRAWRRAQRMLFEALHDPPTALWIAPRETLSLVGRSIVRDMLVEDCGQFRVIDGSDECDTGWTGGMMVAWPLARAGRILGDDEMIAAAHGAADRLCAEGFNAEAQMFFDCWRPEAGWSTEGWWRRWSAGAHLAYINGQTALMLLRMWEDLPGAERGEHMLWRQRAEAIVERAVQLQRADGFFPALISAEDGAAIERDDFAGCWLAAATAALGRMTGDESLLAAADRALAFYGEWASTPEVWGGPIDASGAPDSEGPLALILLAAELHRTSGEPRHLEALVDALEVLFSWQWAYDTHSANEPLRGLGWLSTGGAAASACNIHLAQMNALVAQEMLHAARSADDPYLWARLADAVAFSLGTVNRTDGEFGYGLAGWATEQFYHTDAVQGSLPPDGGIWPRALVWAQACVLMAAEAALDGDLFPRESTRAQE